MTSRLRLSVVLAFALSLTLGLTPSASSAAGIGTSSVLHQTPTPTSPGSTPMLTVADAQIPRCGTINAAGSSFAPNVKMVMVVSGKTMPEQPTTDSAGNFTFTTSVPCEQASGSVQVRAFDGVKAVTIDVTIGADRPTTTLDRADAAPPSSQFDDWALSGVRLLLLAIAAGELVVLYTWRQRRARRRRTPLDAR